MAKKNPVDAAREAYEKALAGIHIDIGSHNKTTRKPRATVKRVVKPKAAPSRVVRKINPTPHRNFNFDTALSIAFKNLQDAVHSRKSETVIQAHVSYVQGLVDAAIYLEYFESAAIGQKLKREMAKLVPLRMV
jgi:hypothetical protein